LLDVETVKQRLRSSSEACTRGLRLDLSTGASIALDKANVVSIPAAAPLTVPPPPAASALAVLPHVSSSLSTVSDVDALAAAAAGGGGSECSAAALSEVSVNDRTANSFDGVKVKLELNEDEEKEPPLKRSRLQTDEPNVDVESMQILNDVFG
jgi:hypothetical protein